MDPMNPGAPFHLPLLHILGEERAGERRFLSRFRFMGRGSCKRFIQILSRNHRVSGPGGFRGSVRYIRCTHQINTTWNGKRHHSTQPGTLTPGQPFTAAFRLAGKTATSSKINPHAANRRVLGKRTPMPPKISATPLAWTKASWSDKYMGIIERYGFGITK
jgi:hypothetical protein